MLVSRDARAVCAWMAMDSIVTKYVRRIGAAEQEYKAKRRATALARKLSKGG